MFEPSGTFFEVWWNLTRYGKALDLDETSTCIIRGAQWWSVAQHVSLCLSTMPATKPSNKEIEFRIVLLAGHPWTQEGFPVRTAIREVFEARYPIPKPPKPRHPQAHQPAQPPPRQPKPNFHASYRKQPQEPQDDPETTSDTPNDKSLDKIARRRERLFGTSAIQITKRSVIIKSPVCSSYAVRYLSPKPLSPPSLHPYCGNDSTSPSVTLRISSPRHHPGPGESILSYKSQYAEVDVMKKLHPSYHPQSHCPAPRRLCPLPRGILLPNRYLAFRGGNWTRTLAHPNPC